MKALVFKGPESISFDEVKEPEIESPLDAVIRVRLAGICGSDLHVYHGREKGLDPGTVMGHEYVGEVLAAGPEAPGLAAGDLVFGSFTTSCGACFYCMRGLTSRCLSGRLFGWRQAGHGLHGAQAEMLRVPLAATTLMKVPPGVTPEAALLLGDNLATGDFCAEMAGVSPGGVWVVIGCGSVGLMAILASREMGGADLLAVDAVPERLERAARLGAATIDYRREDPVARVRARTGGRGADGVMEAVGSPEATRLAYEMVRPGGTIAAAGVHTEPAFAITPAEAYDKNLTYRAGRCPARAYMDKLGALAASGKVDKAGVITHRLPLREGPNAYRIFAERKEGCIKVVLEP